MSDNYDSVRASLCTCKSRDSLGRGKVQLLEIIRETGSLNAAAKQLGISYKTAWDAVKAMDELNGVPLVMRSAGGKRGGGSCLTEAGEKFLEMYHAMEREQEELFNNYRRSFPDAGNIHPVLQRISSDNCCGSQPSFPVQNELLSVINKWPGVVKKLCSCDKNLKVVIDGGLENELYIFVPEAEAIKGLRPGMPVQLQLAPGSVFLRSCSGRKKAFYNSFAGILQASEVAGSLYRFRVGLSSGLFLCGLQPYKPGIFSTFKAGDRVKVEFFSGAVIISL